MLKGIDPIIGPDLLHTLAAMGHGDQLVIADANFPATAVAARLHRLDGLDAVRVLRAVLTLLPIDQYLATPAAVMAVVGEPAATPDIVREFHGVLSEGRDPVPVERLERGAFYERARRAFAVVATGETRLYGNIIISKGVIAPGDRDAHSRAPRNR